MKNLKATPATCAPFQFAPSVYKMEGGINARKSWKSKTQPKSFRVFIEDMKKLGHTVTFYDEKGYSVPYVQVVNPKFIATKTKVKTGFFKETVGEFYTLYPEIESNPKKIKIQLSSSHYPTNSRPVMVNS